MKKKRIDKDVIADLVDLLTAFEGREELPTHELWERVSHRTDLGLFEELGLLERRKVKREGRGKPIVMNSLSDKGKDLLDRLKEYTGI